MDTMNITAPLRTEAELQEFAKSFSSGPGTPRPLQTHEVHNGLRACGFEVTESGGEYIIRTDILGLVKLANTYRQWP